MQKKQKILFFGILISFIIASTAFVVTNKYFGFGYDFLVYFAVAIPATFIITRLVTRN